MMGLNKKYFKSIYILIFLFIVTASKTFSQIVNHNYPRVGFLQWGDARPEWDAKFDLIITPHTNAAYIQTIKSINPDAIVLPAKDIQQGDWIGRHKMPDDWWFRDSGGKLLMIYGGGWKWADYSDFCPPSASFDNKRFNQAIGAEVLKLVNLNLYDGIASDGLWVNGWYGGVDDIDIDRNGVNDLTEHGESWVKAQLSAGAYHTLLNIREAIGDDKILFVNTGTFHTQAWDVTNGLWLEHNHGIYNSWNYIWSKYKNFMNTAKKPQVLLDDVSLGWKGNFTKMRFLLCFMLLGNAYAGNDAIYNHYGVNWYDEFETELGYPTGDAQIVPGTQTTAAGAGDSRAVYARFFDNGVSIVNPTESDVTISDNQLRQMAGYNGPYFRFLGGQNPSFNNGENFTNVVLGGGYEIQGGNTLTLGDGIILLRQTKTIVSDIYVDNCEMGTSPSTEKVKLVGNWLADEAENSSSWQIAYHAWGDEMVYPHDHSLPGNGNNTAIFTPTINVEGNYELFEWHGSSDSYWSASNVPYIITFEGGRTATGTIDQTQNISQWNSLGTFRFSLGKDGNISLSNNANRVVIADAMKFVFQGSGPPDNIPPNEPRNLESESITEHNISLRWSAPLQASDGDIASFYRVYRDDSLLGATNNLFYSDTDLAESSRYYYKIYSVDDRGNSSISPLTGNFSTLSDLISPAIKSVKTLQLSLVEIVFTEAVEQQSAETVNNYTINNGIIINNATLTNDSIVHLTTSIHEIGQTYTIIVNNIRDKALTPNVISANSTTTYTGIEGFIIINISVDNEYELYVNDLLVGTGDSWEDAEVFSVPLINGENVVAVKAKDVGEVAGLAAELYVGEHHFVSNERWKISTSFHSDWELISFDDSSWFKATSLGLHGLTQPWSDYNNIQGISTVSGVAWIWSQDNQNDNLVYFRFQFNTLDMSAPDPPKSIRVVK